MHGCLDREKNQKDPYLQFFPGEEEDGQLTLEDIYKLELSADLVFLSNCNSALGQIIDRGEGLKGIARAFAYAGCPRIIATYNRVKDDHTALILEDFYRYYDGGIKSASALAKSQRDYIKRDKHPSEWCQFIYMGDISKEKRTALLDGE